MIEITNLSKSYGSHQVLEHINLQFESGNVYGVVGENGSGKTTLFKCMAGLEPYLGKVKSDLSPLKDHLGYLATDPFFFTKITGGEYLRLLCQARGQQDIDVNEQNLFDLPLNQYAVTYSTGMKKKLAFTGILMQGNEIFILDEPYNGVDIQSNVMITEIISKLKSLNKTVIISSHIFSTLQDTCDQIHLLKNGKIRTTANANEFAALDKEMKDFIIGDKIEKLILK